MLASESIAFDMVNADFVRDILLGEIVIIDKSGLRSEKLSKDRPETFCAFEYIYFAHPNSVLRGRSVYNIR